MKDFFKDYVHIIAMAIVGLVFGVSFYYLLINAFHAASISKVVHVNPSDIYYQGYQNNLVKIKNNLDRYSFDRDKFNYNITEMQHIYSDINYCYGVLTSNETIIGYIEGQNLGYVDVYNLNNYFINSLIDSCYTSNLSWIVKDDVRGSLVKERLINASLSLDILSYNSSYVKDELRDNSSYYYNTAISNSTIRDDLNSSYRMVLKNYNSFAEIILELSDYLVRGDVNE